MTCNTNVARLFRLKQTCYCSKNYCGTIGAQFKFQISDQPKLNFSEVEKSILSKLCKRSFYTLTTQKRKKYGFGETSIARVRATAPNIQSRSLLIAVPINNLDFERKFRDKPTPRSAICYNKKYITKDIRDQGR